MSLDRSDHELLGKLVTALVTRLEALERALDAMDVTLERVAEALEARKEEAV